MTDEYDKAEYYDASGDPESLSHSSPEEAIEHMLNSWAEPGCDMRALIAEYGACTVTAYARAVITDEELARRAVGCTENFAENFDDDHGGDDPTFSTEALATIATGMANLFRAAVDASQVWACEKCGKREYTVEETEAMMREHCPEWFEEGDTDG